MRWNSQTIIWIAQSGITVCAVESWTDVLFSSEWQTCDIYADFVMPIDLAIYRIRGSSVDLPIGNIDSRPTTMVLPIPFISALNCSLDKEHLTWLMEDNMTECALHCPLCFVCFLTNQSIVVSMIRTVALSGSSVWPPASFMDISQIVTFVWLSTSSCTLGNQPFGVSAYIPKTNHVRIVMTTEYVYMRTP